MDITHRPVADGNWKKGREGNRQPDMIVVHVVEGSASACRSWFNDPDAGVSAHYLVTRDGKVEQFVDEQDTAYHAGRVARPTAKLVIQRPGVNPNAYSIGIEHEGSGKDDLTMLQRIATLDLIHDIARRRKIPLDRDHIVGHREIFADKTCPGRIDVDALVRGLQAEEDRRAAPPAPLVVWSPHARDWLIVTRVVSDTEWYFLRFSQLQGLAPTKSSVSLRTMPRRPE